VKSFLLQIPCWLLLFQALAPAQSKKNPSGDEGLVLPPIAVDKKKVKENNQAPPKQIEIPAAVNAETARISFEIAPVSTKGLLSQQTRDALRALLRGNRGATVVRLRAFVAGSGDLRRIGDIAGEIFTERHQPMPALTVVQVGALPIDGQQVLIESTEMERSPVNPAGLAFVAGQAGDSLPQALDRVRAAVRAVGSSPADALRVSCFVSSLDRESASVARLSSEFSQAATLLVQMQRAPVQPGAECEAVVRLHALPQQPLQYLDPAEVGPAAKGYSQIALVGAPKLVFTGAQLGFGTRENDIKLVFERLGRVLATFQSGFDRIAVSSLYLTSAGLAQKIRDVRGGFYLANSPASTLLPFEALPSIDGSFAADLVAITP
jgi:enamine deaminase RidA (YjgF/YER057c/UK114 family)